MAQVTTLWQHGGPGKVRSFIAKDEADNVAGPYVVAAVGTFIPGPFISDAWSSAPAASGDYVSGPVAVEDK